MSQLHRSLFNKYPLITQPFTSCGLLSFQDALNQLNKGLLIELSRKNSLVGKELIFSLLALGTLHQCYMVDIAIYDSEIQSLLIRNFSTTPKVAAAFMIFDQILFSLIHLSILFTVNRIMVDRNIKCLPIGFDGARQKIWGCSRKDGGSELQQQPSTYGQSLFNFEYSSSVLLWCFGICFFLHRKLVIVVQYFLDKIKNELLKKKIQKPADQQELYYTISYFFLPQADRFSVFSYLFSLEKL